MAAAAALRHRVLELGLTPLVAAAAGQRRALLLKRGKLAARILDAVVHLEALRAAHQRLAEDEEALEAAGILHGRLGALEHAVILGDLLVEAREVVAVGAAALRGGSQLLLELKAADLLLARPLRERKPGASSHGQAAERKRGEPASADRPHGRREHAPKIAINPHDLDPIPGSQ